MRDRPYPEGCRVERLPVERELRSCSNESVINALLAAAEIHSRKEITPHPSSSSNANLTQNMSARRRTSSKRRFCLWSSVAKQKRANRLEHPSVASHRIHLDVHNPDLSLDRYCYSSGLSNGTSRYQCSQRASCHYRPARPKFELVRTSGIRSIHTRGESLECK